MKLANDIGGGRGQIGREHHFSILPSGRAIRHQHGNIAVAYNPLGSRPDKDVLKQLTPVWSNDNKIDFCVTRCLQNAEKSFALGQAINAR